MSYYLRTLNLFPKNKSNTLVKFVECKDCDNCLKCENSKELKYDNRNILSYIINFKLEDNDELNFKIRN